MCHPKFSSVMVLFILYVATINGKSDPSSLDYKLFLHMHTDICDRILEKQPVSEKNKFLFYCFVTFYV